MKKLLLILLFPVLLLSCSKPDDKALLEEVCDGLRGRYLCSSITYLGSPVDLDGDGICSTDLIKEFQGISKDIAALEDYQRIRPSSNYDEECSFILDIPLQGVHFDKLTETYRPVGYISRMYVNFSYMVAHDGAVSFRTHNDGDAKFWDDWGDEIRDIDNKFTRGDHVVSFDNGKLVIVVQYAFYDYSTSSFVQGAAECTYERVSYSLY